MVCDLYPHDRTRSEIKSMVEVYSGCTIEEGDGMECEEKEFENVVPYHNDSDIDEEYGVQEVVYVVYQEDEGLIMQQKRDAIMGVFPSKRAAKQFKEDLLNEDTDFEIGIQEMVVHDGLESES